MGNLSYWLGLDWIAGWLYVAFVYAGWMESVSVGRNELSKYRAGVYRDGSVAWRLK